MPTEPTTDPKAVSLEEALKFYAEAAWFTDGDQGYDHNDNIVTVITTEPSDELLADQGKRARAALTLLKEGMGADSASDGGRSGASAPSGWRPIREHGGFGSPDVLVGCWVRLPGIRPYFYRTVAHPSDNGWWNVSADEELVYEPHVFAPLPDPPPVQEADAPSREEGAE